MDCKNCVKEDVCKQKELLKEVKNRVSDIFIDGDSMKTIAIVNGITVEVNCNKAVKKQTEFRLVSRWQVLRRLCNEK